MSLLVHYTLKSADDHTRQQDAMIALVNNLKSEGIVGTGGLNYTCFASDDPTKFVGVLEFADESGKEAFLASKAFATYREAVGPTFANPPETTAVSAVASTRE